jgi:hypothetical protein
MDSIEKCLWGTMMKRIWTEAQLDKETTLIKTGIAVHFIKQDLMA